VTAGVDHPQNHFACVDPDASFDRRPALAFQPLAVTSEFLLDCERGAKRTLRMVLMGNRRSEHRKNAVTGQLHYVTVVAMYSAHHKVQYRVDNGAGLLRVELTDKLHRALNVGEERGDRLALALDGVGRQAFNAGSNSYCVFWCRQHSSWRGPQQSCAARVAASRPCA